MCFPGGSDGKESTCNAGDLGSIPGSGRSPGEGNGNHSSILTRYIFPSVFRVCQLSLDFICLPVNLSIVCPGKDIYFHTDSFTNSLLLLHLDLSLRILSINSGYMSQLIGK